MFKLKRSWLYETKWIFWSLSAFSILMTLLTIISTTNDTLNQVFIRLYSECYQVTLMLMCIYPVYVLKMMSPKLNQFFDAPQITAHLPFSKKELFYKGLKPWAIVFPCYFILATLILYYLEGRLVEESWTVWWSESMLENVFAFFVILCIVLQTMTAMLLSLVNQYSWYKLFPWVIVANVIFIITSVWIMVKFNFHYSWTFLPLGVWLLLSLGAFMVHFKEIERIYQ